MREDKKGISRRNFAKKSAMALAGIPLVHLDNGLLKPKLAADDAIEVHLFSKHLQFLDYDDMSAAAADIGFNGLDLTVRPKGHILPEKVNEDLPAAVEAMKKFGLKPKMMTTNVWDIKDIDQQEVLKTASTFGFEYYRTGWLSYPEDTSIDESLIHYANQAKILEDFNKELGLIGCYQNHAGNHVGAPIWDLPTIFSKTNNEFLGCQYDIRHAVVEGGKSWELDLRRIHSYIKSIVVKDFKWGKKNGSWQPINTPLGEGMVDFNRYFSLLKKYKVKVPISLHLEYDLGGAEHGAKKITMDKKEVFAKMKKDLTYIQEAWKKVE
ncbi:sugar phosphate isomerase/epimerase family protein [Maribacter ulvicola]|uniref:Sugar phosphate isomerase/epimerase n=1 Tax=Maribacter ulvicola TaxID=228959 RepID=A0A1N6WN41_9FLAO|nr:TIM barrel protein [Maribacter ulvicola]SIQ91466.1 Sugar phosphate isomerase/epimerase [Maribacter ulvicola]